MFNVQIPLNVGFVNLNTGVSAQNSGKFQFLPDKVELSSFDRLFSESFIKKAILNNPHIRKIIKKFNPEMKLNMEELKLLMSGHLQDTKNVSQGIVENLPYSLQMQIDKKALFDASYLHDLGKVLIPDEILNKPNKLTSYEKSIMDLHSELGFELLKNAGIDKPTLYLIKNHHKQPNGIYKIFQPEKNNDFTLQILSTADKYSALLEQRVYKRPLSPKEALTIIYRDVESGNLDERIFNALVRYSKDFTTIPEASIS